MLISAAGPVMSYIATPTFNDADDDILASSNKIEKMYLMSMIEI